MSKLSRALQLWRGKRKESFQLRLWNLNICIEKSLSEMLICGDDISNDVVTLGFCFHVFFNVCVHSRLFALRPDWQKSDSLVNGERHRRIGGEIQIPAPPPERPRELARRLSWSVKTGKKTWPISSHLVDLTVGQLRICNAPSPFLRGKESYSRSIHISIFISFICKL